MTVEDMWRHTDDTLADIFRLLLTDSRTNIATEPTKNLGTKIRVSGVVWITDEDAEILRLVAAGHPKYSKHVSY